MAGVVFGGMRLISHRSVSNLSTEPCRVAVTTSTDPTGDVALFALTPITGTPALEDWATGQWEATPLSSTGEWVAYVTLGPDAFSLAPGEYTVWVTVEDNPSVPVAEVAVITVTGPDQPTLVSPSAFLAVANNLHDVADVATARTNLGLGTAATHPSTDFDPAGAAAVRAAIAGDLGGTASTPQVVATHLAAALPLAQGGTAATTASGARTSLGLGGAAVLNVGTTTGTVTAGDDTRLSDARTPTAHASTHGLGHADPVTIDHTQVTGLGGAAVLAVGTTTGTVAAGDDPRFTAIDGGTP